MNAMVNFFFSSFFSRFFSFSPPSHRKPKSPQTRSTSSFFSFRPAASSRDAISVHITGYINQDQNLLTGYQPLFRFLQPFRIPGCSLSLLVWITFIPEPAENGKAVLTDVCSEIYVSQRTLQTVCKVPFIFQPRPVILRYKGHERHPLQYYQCYHSILEEKVP